MSAPKSGVANFWPFGAESCRPSLPVFHVPNLSDDASSGSPFRASSFITAGNTGRGGVPNKAGRFRPYAPTCLPVAGRSKTRRNFRSQCIEDDVYSAAALHRVDPAFVRVGKRTGSQLNQARTVFRRSGSEILGRLGASITSGAHGPPHHSGRARKPFGLPAHVPRASKRKSGVVRPHGPRPARRKIRAPSSDEAP